ncbi:MAG: hypothetical protein MJ230_01535, partial [bacterium]|nr:hypothetical protein [bacterium]
FGDYLEFCGDAILEMVNDGERMAILGAIGDDLGSTFMKLVDFIGQGVLKFVEWVTSAEGLTTIQGWVENLTDALDWCIDNWDSIVEVTKNAVIVFGVLDGIVKLLVGGFSAYVTYTSLASFATGVLGVSLGGLAVTALGVVAVVGLVAYAIYSVWDMFAHWDEKVAWWEKTWGEVGEWLEYTVDWWKEVLGNFAKWVDDTVFKPITEGWQTLIDAFNDPIAVQQAVNDPVGNWVDGAKALGWIPHADGGLMTKPHLGVVGEDGPEMIIPLSADKRGSAVDMWQTTGNMLGVKSYGTDSLSGGSTVYGGSTNYAPTVNINVTGGSDRGTIRQIEDAVKEALEESFASALRRRPRETYV